MLAAAKSRDAFADTQVRITYLEGANRDQRQLYEMHLSEAQTKAEGDAKAIQRLKQDVTVKSNKLYLARGVEQKALESAGLAREQARRAVDAEGLLRAATVKCNHLRREAASAVSREQYKQLQQVSTARIRRLERQVAQLQEDVRELQQQEEDPDDEEDAPAPSSSESDSSESDNSESESSAPPDELALCKLALETLRVSVGVDPWRASLPNRSFTGNDTLPTAEDNWRKASVRHIAAVISGRPAEHVVAALTRHQRDGTHHPTLSDFVAAENFQCENKKIVQAAAARQAAHWSARLSVHLWDRLNLSRPKMEDLRHLLSYTYSPVTDDYTPNILWQNPYNPMDLVPAVPLVGRFGRERLFNELAEECDIVVGENGRCERDAGVLVASLYATFITALRTTYSTDRPAMPILFFDGTGGSLGRGLCHAEMGSADFVGDARQSRATLRPLAMYEGNDHALPLRANLGYVMASFNQLVANGFFERFGDLVHIPCEPIIVADMQGIKCMAGMSETCHSVWCKCKKGDNGSHHNYGPIEDFKTPQEMDKFIAKELKCEFKKEEFITACAHMPIKGKWRACPCCGYRPSPAQGKADLARFNSLTDEEQKMERKEHIKLGAHWHIELYMGMMTIGLDMTRYGCDQLHLVYLNMFKHIFKYTIHEPLPISKKKIVARYLKAAHFYSYDADDESDDPTKRWIGREVKRFLHEADVHLPFLLGLSCTSIDQSACLDQYLNPAGQEGMDLSDDEFVDEEIEDDPADSMSQLQLNATRWDHFLDWVRGLEQTWDPEDTLEYRNKRALQYCNGARRVSRDLLEMKPSMASWVPHIASWIVPRQIVELGDPSRRAADACESYGACCKFVVKHLTRRRTMSPSYSRGWIAQAFRRLSVRSNLLEGPENAPYTLRQDHKLLATGLKNTVSGTVEGPHHSIRVKVEYELENA